MGKPSTGRRFFSPEFKREAVKRMAERRAQGVSLAQISRELDVRPDMLRGWQRQQQAADGTAPAPGVSAERVPSDADEVRRLQRELARAQQEIAFLKSAAAYFARESR